MNYNCYFIGKTFLGKWYKSSQSSVNLQSAQSPSGSSSPFMFCSSKHPAENSDHYNLFSNERKIKTTRHHVVTAVIESRFVTSTSLEFRAG